MVRDLLGRDDETYAVADLPTAYLNRVQYRFRFSVVDGRVTHAAGRPADLRPAREYFGGRRREIEAYCARFGASAWQDLIGIAEQAAAAFPGLRSVGVDLAPDQVGRRDINRGTPDPDAIAKAKKHMSELSEKFGIVFPEIPLRMDAASSPTVAHDVVYDIDPFGAHLPGAHGLPGTTGEGLDVPATVLRGWAAQRGR
jgi:hypothetical protein